MKKVLWTLAILALTSGAAYAQDVNEPTQQDMPARPVANTLDKGLIGNEKKINEAIAKGDKAAFAALVSPSSISADANGFVKGSDMLAMFEQAKITSWAMSDEKVTWIDPNNAIVTYKWTGAGTFMGQPLPGTTYSSTVWTKKAKAISASCVAPVRRWRN
jgi:hypothetical protein